MTAGVIDEGIDCNHFRFGAGDSSGGGWSAFHYKGFETIEYVFVLAQRTLKIQRAIYALDAIVSTMRQRLSRDTARQGCLRHRAHPNGQFAGCLSKPFPRANHSRGLVAWVCPRRLPWLACTLPTVSSGRPRCGVAPP